MTDVHVDNDLSAYLDGEVAAPDRARIEAHLDGCGRCRARLEELRATASLIAALPSAHPSRSLVPKLETLHMAYGVDQRRPVGWNWLRPIRSLSAVASGAFLFVFLVAAVARSGAGLGGGAAAPAATAAFGQNVPAASAAAAQHAARTGVPFLLAPSTQAAAGAAQPTGPPKAVEAATASPAPREEIAPSPAPRVEVQASAQALTDVRIARDPAPSPLSDPLVWLGLAVIAAVVAVAAHWRLGTV